MPPPPKRLSGGRCVGRSVGTSHTHPTLDGQYYVFELNIVAAPPPAKPAPKKPSAPKPAAPTQSSEGVSQEAKPLAAAPASQPLIQSAEALSGSSSSSSSSAPAKKRKAQVEQAPPTGHPCGARSTATNYEFRRRRRRRRTRRRVEDAKNDDGGASSRMLEQQLMGRKQDPSRAAPLPSTVKLTARPPTRRPPSAPRHLTSCRSIRTCSGTLAPSSASPT